MELCVLTYFCYMLSVSSKTNVLIFYRFLCRVPAACFVRIARYLCGKRCHALRCMYASFCNYFSFSDLARRIACIALNFDAHTVQNVFVNATYSELELKHNNYHLTLM